MISSLRLLILCSKFVILIKRAFKEDNMGYKDILNVNNNYYKETDRYNHLKDPNLARRYYANYLDYKKMPTLDDFINDLLYLNEEQADYPTEYALTLFPESQEIPDELLTFLTDNGFELSKHIIFTNTIDRRSLSTKSIEPIIVEALSDAYFMDYLQLKYSQNMEYGKDYADHMLAYNQVHLPEKGSKIFIARDGDKLIGDVTAWYYDKYIEIDDFSILQEYRGKGIGSELQRQASKGYNDLILISEEENRNMYQHQGYQEVSFYWTALKAPKTQNGESEEMMTEEKILEAQAKFSGNDFPGLVKAFLEMGIVENTVNIQNGTASYKDKKGQVIDLPAYKVESVARQTDKDNFLKNLQIHQVGETDFPTFCHDSAAAGIYKWDVDLLKKTCSYYNLDNQLVYSEPIPV